MDRDFLIGVFAAQLGFASSEQVIAAASAWISDRSKSISDRLLGEGAITPSQKSMLDNIVDESLKVHDGDVHQTLETLGGERAMYASFGGSVLFDDAGQPSLPAQTKPERPSIDGEDATSLSREEPGRYRFEGDTASEAEIGRGGIGRVLVAHDAHIGREIAVKELLEGPGSGSPGVSPVDRTAALAARFLREARVTGQLEHPNIVPVYELGKRADGTLYYTMKLVRGKTLADALRQAGDLPDRLKLLPHFADLCNAVAYAHSRGVIHRDIKPANVMLGEFGETVLLDWGLAKTRGKKDIFGDDLEREVKVLKDAEGGKTIDGSAIGTPAYMSPEQADGRIDDIDERSDIWGLGAVLYELLTGRPPYDGMTEFDVIGKVLTQPVLPPREHDDLIPVELEAVALHALERDKARRYQQARELAEEVEAYQAGDRVGAYEYRSVELLGRFVSRNKALTALTMAVVVLLCVSTFGIFNAYRRSEVNRVRAEAALESAYTSDVKAGANLAEALLWRAEQEIDGHNFSLAKLFASQALASSAGTDAETRLSHGQLTRATSVLYNATMWERLVHVATIPASERPVRAVAFSPDGKLLATGEKTGTELVTRLWSLDEPAAPKALFC